MNQNELDFNSHSFHREEKNHNKIKMMVLVFLDQLILGEKTKIIKKTYFLMLIKVMNSITRITIISKEELMMFLNKLLLMK